MSEIDELNSSAIVEAKKEYTTQLCSLLTPFIYEGFKIIWSSCKDNEKARKKFQEKLCMVPNWNKNIIEDEFKRITKDIDPKLIEKLIKAVFLSNIKVLSSIRINNKSKINIPIPNSSDFIHKCYIDCARKFWTNPKLMDDRETDFLSFDEIQENVDKSYNLIRDCIPGTINNTINFDEIIENFLDEALDNLETNDIDIDNDANTTNDINDCNNFNTDVNTDVNTNDDNEYDNISDSYKEEYNPNVDSTEDPLMMNLDNSECNSNFVENTTIQETDDRLSATEGDTIEECNNDEEVRKISSNTHNQEQANDDECPFFDEE